MRYAALAVAATTLFTAVTCDTTVHRNSGPPQALQFYDAPSLTDIRDILARFVPAIVSTVVQRMALPVNPQLYAGGDKSALHAYLAAHETLGIEHHRYDYGTLEYAFTTNTIVPDVTTSSNPYPPGRFHQDSFTPNDNLTKFYVEEFVPLLNASTNSYFAHLSNATQNLFPGKGDDDAALSLDVILLQLLSNRASNGKVVAESKFLADPANITALIKAQDVNSIHTILVNRTQEGVVLDEADNAAVLFASAWNNAGGLPPPTFETSVRNATFKVFRNLIDITTQTEVEYLLGRLH